MNTKILTEKQIKVNAKSCLTQNDTQIEWNLTQNEPQRSSKAVP